MQVEAEKPHEQSDPASIVVHVAILEVACHAGGRGFVPSLPSYLNEINGRYAVLRDLASSISIA